MWIGSGCSEESDVELSMSAPVLVFTICAPKSCFLNDAVFFVEAGDAPGKSCCKRSRARSAVKGPGVPGTATVRLFGGGVERERRFM